MSIDLRNRLAGLNLSRFSRETGIPRRTLTRIRSGAAISTVTLKAVQAALRRYKP